MIVFDTLFALVTIYIFIYCVYQLFFLIKAYDIEKYFKMQEKTRNMIVDKNMLAVVIYATSKDKNLEKLLSTLNNQTYKKENYEVHVAYQKDQTDNSLSKDYIQGAKIHDIQNSDYFSKDKAINLLLDKLIEEDKFSAFVFLGADRVIGEKYLENVNKSIQGSGVYTGARVSINENPQLAKEIKQAIIQAYLKYTNLTSNLTRSMFDLSSQIDGGNVVVTSDVIKKIGYVGLEDKTSELEFSLDLAINDVKTKYSPYIISAVDVKNYDFSSPLLRDKITLFIHYFPILIFKNNSYREFIMFLLKPNSLFIIFSYLVLGFLALTSPAKLIDNTFYTLSLFLLINFIISVKVTKMNTGEIFWLLFYPLCLTWQKTKLLINALTMRSIINSRYEEENINSATINATIYNGKKDVSCKLDLVSEDGMRKVIFREGNRFITTDSFLRMYDAMVDMTYKLESKGIILKTCQNCQNFTLRPDGTLDCLNGKCQVSGAEILIWNGCQFFRGKEK